MPSPSSGLKGKYANNGERCELVSMDQWQDVVNVAYVSGTGT
jgi:hypothetical protein